MSDPKCMRCNDVGVVGGFLPAPCPGCRVPDEVDRLKARLAEVELERDYMRPVVDLACAWVDWENGDPRIDWESYKLREAVEEYRSKERG